MKNWKIGLRISVGFAVVILISVALAFFAIDRAVEVEKKSDAVAANYLPSVLALNDLQANTFHMAANIHQLIGSSDPADKAKLNDEIVSIRGFTKKDVEFYESTPLTPEERATYNELKAVRVDYLRVIAEVHMAGLSSDPVEVAKAQQLFAEQFRPLYEKYTGLMQKLADMSKQGANEGLVSIHSSVASMVRAVLIGLLLSVAISIPITIYIVRGITRPLSLAVSTLEKVAGGDMTATLDVSTRDEVGRMAAALNKAVQRLDATLREVAGSAAQAAASSQELAAASEAIASGAQEQAASLEETSASLEQVTANMRQSADQAQQASKLATGSRDSALEGQAVVAKAIIAMGEINSGSTRIGDIVSTIDEIAFQTNLLAINAAVEAARAGEEGRGFAVVATEVRSLALRSAAAAKEIKGLIEESLRKQEAGSALVNRSGETLGGIVASVKQVTEIVGEIAAASGEESIGVEQVNTAMTQMDQVTQSNSSQTQQLSAMAQALSEQAAELLESVSAFTLTQDEEGRQGRQPRQAKPARPAETRLARSVPAAGKKFGHATLQPVKGARTKGVQSVTAKPAAVHAGPGANDGSFEEF
jgi:methyl-accepting chemotaxis protein